MFYPPIKRPTGDRPPPLIQTVKHHNSFENTVTLQIEDSCRKGVGWKEAMRRVRWYLVFDGTQRDLTDFVFGK
jgi:hypothetical protein